MKKIPLIFRRTNSNRLTLPVLFHVLETGGWERLFDLRLADSLETMTSAISDAETAVIAYSFLTSNLPEVLSEIPSLRAVGEDRIILVAGGPHPVGDPEGTLKLGFDIVSAGEGEATLPGICEEVLNHGNTPKKRIFRSDAPIDLDGSFPISRTVSPISPLEITRGCFHRCRFCQTGGVPPRHRSLESVKTYLTELRNRGFLFRAGFISPSGFEYGSEKPGRLSPERLETLLRMAKEIGIEHLEYGIFPSEVRPNTVHPEFLRLVTAYCANRKLTIGAQTGSDRLLKRLRRGHTKEDIERSTALTREHGLTPQLDFILGFPGEAEEEQLRTLDFIRHLGLDYKARIQMHFFLPLSGTPLENQEPTFPGKRVTDRLESYHRAGFCSDWWKKGMELSRSIVKIRRRFAHRND